MRIRRAFPEDRALLNRLIERAYSTFMAPAYDPESLAAALPFLTKANLTLLKSGTYYVVEDDTTGRLLGCGGWTRERPGTKDITSGVAHLRHFATEPAAARNGVGRAIFRQCAPAAESAGAQIFEACSSLNAEPFYRSLGLLPVARAELVLAKDVVLPVVIMRGPIPHAIGN
ncbi:MAG: GNAT family N-acetyltransferase [Parvibaculaceae bacterium]